VSAFAALDDLPIGALVAFGTVRVAGDADLRAVAIALTEADVGVVVVAGGSGADDVLGVVSERDVVRALAAGKDPSTTTAAEVATTTIVWCDTASTVTEVAAEMMDRYVRHVLVRDDHGLAGVVSVRDVLAAYASAALSGDDDDA
jgi:CBS domain-containing protein